MDNKNSIFIGLFLGAIFPVIGYVVIEFLFNLMTDAGWMAETSASTLTRRIRTLALIGICFNLIPFNYAKHKRWDDTMRGIIFPTLIYIGFWLFKFGPQLF